MGRQDTVWILSSSLDNSILAVDSLENPIVDSPSKKNLWFVNSHLKLSICVDIWPPFSQGPILTDLKTTTKGKAMDQMNKEDRQRILESAPVGTWALMLIVGAGMVVAWLFLYYGVFLPRGGVN